MGFSVTNNNSSTVRLIIRVILLGAIFTSLADITVADPTLGVVNVRSGNCLCACLVSAAINCLVTFVLGHGVAFGTSTGPALDVVLCFVVIIFAVFTGN